MQTRSDAEEHLRIIRSLMEKATIYRAISAPTALVGGLASVVATFVGPSPFAPSAGPIELARSIFLATWLAVLAITAFANTWFLWFDARRRKEKFLSAGMRAAVRAFSPSYLTAAFFTFLFSSAPEILPPIWMLFYGLGLLATQHFAPRSIALLGWAFLAAGLLFLVPIFRQIFHVSPRVDHANVAMGVTFGLFHLIYAAFAWPRGRAATAAHSNA